jgi:ketosteroid isomerase-like protein
MALGKDQAQGWLADLFAAIDCKNVERFLGFLADDARFRFGNNPASQGKQAIGAAVGGFFASIDACHHEVLGSWTQPDSVICHGQVTYTRRDQRRVTVPFANVLMLRGGLIRDYLIFVDVSPLYA